MAESNIGPPSQQLSGHMGIAQEWQTGSVGMKEDYITPLDDPLHKASKYLSKHDIFGLLQNITAGIAYKRPAESLEYMINEIEKIQEKERQRKGMITCKPTT